MEQQTGSKLGKEYFKAVYCHPTYLTPMQGTSSEIPGDEATSWNQVCQEKYQSPHICRYYHFNGESEEELKSLLRVTEETEKACLKLNIKKTKILVSGPMTSLKIGGEKVETVSNVRVEP